MLRSSGRGLMIYPQDHRKECIPWNNFLGFYYRYRDARGGRTFFVEQDAIAAIHHIIIIILDYSNRLSYTPQSHNSLFIYNAPSLHVQWDRVQNIWINNNPPSSWRIVHRTIHTNIYFLFFFLTHPENHDGRRDVHGIAMHNNNNNV